ncbi:MAG: reverse transcriptase domain-containing protein [Cyanobacteriota bacterium]
MPSPPLRNLWPHLTSFTSLHAAALQAQRGKRYRPAVLAFNARLEANLFRLQEELCSFTYRPGPYRQFEIRDHNRLLISADPYRDRVVHHALCATIAPPLERGFLPTTFANRRGFGSHKALRRFVAECGSHRWVFSADIRLYFPSIDLTILRQQLAERISCPDTLWLLDQILANGASHGPALDAFPGDTLLTPLERSRGLPIGNLTSQFLANFHLNAIDHRLAALPGIGAYLRYVDDMVLFANSPEPLRQALLCLETELAALRLRLHPIKSQIRQTRHGVSFVGFRALPKRVRVRNHNLLNGKRRLRRQQQAVVSGALDSEAARASLQSWNAHLAHGHTWRLRQRLFADVPFATALLTQSR